MTVSEIIGFLNKNPGITINKAAQQLGVDRSTVEMVAKVGGIKIARKDKTVCNGAPKACFSCPYPDCINKRAATKAETEMVAIGIGMQYHTGKPLRKKKRGKHCDKQKNQGDKGAG